MQYYLWSRAAYSFAMGITLAVSPFSYLRWQDNKLHQLANTQDNKLAQHQKDASLLARTLGCFNLGVAQLFLFAALQGSPRGLKIAVLANGLLVRSLIVFCHFLHGAWSFRWLGVNIPFFVGDMYFLVKLFAKYH